MECNFSATGYKQNCKGEPTFDHKQFPFQTRHIGAQHEAARSRKIFCDHLLQLFVCTKEFSFLYAPLCSRIPIHQRTIPTRKPTKSVT